jgi:hypothetical protein
MTDHANGQERVTSSRHCKRHGPHQTQGLQNIMANGDIGNISQRANFVVEHKVPAIHDRPSDGVEHDEHPFLNIVRVYVPTGRLDQVMELVSGTTTSSTLVDRPYLAAVLSPEWQCLPLARPAKRIGRLTVFSGLSGAPSKRFPALDLTPIFLEHPRPHEVLLIRACAARSPCANSGS